MKLEEVKHKKVLLRVDYNVPISDDVIMDSTRIDESYKTLKFLINNNNSVIILSHLGKVKTLDDRRKNTLKPVYKYLQKTLPFKVLFCAEAKGKTLEKMAYALKPKEILLIENTRSLDYPNNDESSCNDALSKYWASLADAFVFDAFGTIHRNHASTYGISKYLPSYKGFLVDKELYTLKQLLVARSKSIILGGSKVSDKLGVISNLIDTCDKFMLGGLISLTFIKALNLQVGKNTVDDSKIGYVKSLLDKYPEKILLPLDYVTQDGVKDANKLVENDICMDIGPRTVELFKKNAFSNYVVFNGPMGYVEDERYVNGTLELMKYISNQNINFVVAGGDSLSVLNKFDIKAYYCSTGGGATLEYLSGKEFIILENLI